MNTTNFTNQFLIAMPSLKDPAFSQSVVYMCEHNDEGAIGIIINHPSSLNLDKLFEHISIDSDHAKDSDLPVLYGGPLQQDRGFVIHRPKGNWRSTLEMAPDIAITTSQDILEAVAKGKGPKDVLVALGYAGWEGGQIEQEILDNDWLSYPADTSIIFETPFADRWMAATTLMGVDIHSLSDDVGHA